MNKDDLAREIKTICRMQRVRMELMSVRRREAERRRDDGEEDGDGDLHRDENAVMVCMNINRAHKTHLLIRITTSIGRSVE